MKRLLVVVALLTAVSSVGALNPQLGKVIVTARDNSGNAIANATVKVCYQGATVQGAQSGTSPFAVTVEDVGGLNVDVGATGAATINTGSTIYTASITSESVITLTGFAGTLALADDDRIVMCDDALPSLYNDSQGSEGVANPLTSSSTGLAEAWVRGGSYDIKISKTGITTTLIQDYYVSAEDTRLNTYPVTSAVTMYRLAAARSTTWNASDKLFVVGRTTTDEFYVDGVGGMHATGASDVSTGGLTVTGTVAVTGALTTTTSATIGSGLTVSAGTVSLPAGEIGTTEIASNAVTTAAVTAEDTTDNTFTAEEVLITSPSITITASNVVTVIEFNASVTINGGTTQVTFNLRRGGVAGTLLYTWRYEHNNAGAGDHTIPVSLHYTALSEPAGAQTYTITGTETGAGSAQAYGSTVDGTHITVYEVKK